MGRSKNIDYYKSHPGKLKVISLVLALISTVLGYYCFFGSELKRINVETNATVEYDFAWKEIYFVTVTSLCLVLGIVDIIIHTCSVAVIYDHRTAFYDFGFHCTSALLLLASGLLLAISTVEYHDDGCTPEAGCQLFIVKLLTGLFTLITGVSYGVVGVVVFTHRRDQDV